jgi:CubicO group peptidase (beta-lactamase class C family)
MKKWLAWSLIAIGGTASAAPLPRSTPEEQGVSSEGILAFIEAADKTIDTMNSVMIVRHGQVIAEGWWKPYDANTPHDMFSLSKSFTSTAVGLAIADGKFSLDDPILKFFPDQAPANPSENLQKMRVRDLLIMSTGHIDNDLKNMGPLDGPAPSKAFLETPVALKPGTHFIYNTPATYMLSAIVQKTTGEKVLDYLRPRLFQPLGIENPTWEESAEGVSYGGFGLALKTEDIARFGLLILRKGEWQGKRLVPADWIAAATARQTSTGSNPTSDWDQGYGYQFWRSRHGFRGDGAHGQFCFVLPDLDANIAITSGTSDMQAVMNVVWNHLLPAMKADVLPANDADRKKLSDRLGKLEVRRAEGGAAPKLASSISGKRYAFEKNPAGLTVLAVDWRSRRGTPVIKMAFEGADQQVVCSKNEWIKGRASFGHGSRERPVAATCAWKSADTFTAKIVQPETPYYYDLNLRFAGQEAILDARTSVSKPGETLHLVGKAQ